MKCNLVNENFQSDYINNLLRARGVTDIDGFIHPNKSALQDPIALKNIDIGIALFMRIVNTGNSHILIIIDSDDDGFTSSAILYQYTKRLNPNCDIDYWLHDGKQHGLQDHIAKLTEDNIHYDLIIIPDAGSNDKVYHEKLDEVNMPCLVLDHHLVDLELSDNAIIINNQLSPNYKNKELTGAGVVYQFCRRLDEKLGHNWADDYIDLAALGIIGDMGGMLELENRYICATGLEKIRNPLFKAILKKQAYSITGKVDATWQDILDALTFTSISFYVVPLINAVIRIGSMEEKELLFNAFIKGDELVVSKKRGAKGEMVPIAEEAARVASNVKAKQATLRESISEKMELKISKYDLLRNKILLIRLEDEDNFPSELNGLTAMYLAAKYKRPTLMLRCNSEGNYCGSARGLNDSALKDFKQFLTDSGLSVYAAGHAQAFGYAINKTNIDKLLEYSNEKLKDFNFSENCFDVNFARTANAQDLPKLVNELGAATYLWGTMVSEPLIYVTQLYINKKDVRIMGQNKDTIKIESGGISYLKFKAKDFIEELNKYSGTVQLELVGRANLNEWNGRISNQIFIDDYEIKPIEAALEF